MKFIVDKILTELFKSPPVREAWIEIGNAGD